MVKRNKVAIIYENNENWIGGTYYIQNLILALNTLSDERRPFITILCSKEKEYEEIRNSGYPHLSWKPLQFIPVRLPLYNRIVNKLYQRLKGFDKYPQPVAIDTEDCEILFPALIGLKNEEIRKIFWIPDFQEQKLPDFFSAAEIKNRTESHRFIAVSKEHVVFSSEDAHQTFEHLFPKSLCKKHLLQFAVTHPVGYKQLDASFLKTKYQIDQPYFFAPNQFWKHKNQLTILKAVSRLRKAGAINFLIVFSGKEHDYRNPDYVRGLKDFVASENLENNVRFLGFIDRQEQLKLMSEAVAIIQPSLFEGWSTVVEDAKAMNQWLVASDLAVHREQLLQNVSFFKPEDDAALADILKEGLMNGFSPLDNEYDKSRKKFASDFISIVEEATA